LTFDVGRLTFLVPRTANDKRQSSCASLFRLCFPIPLPEPVFGFASLVVIDNYDSFTYNLVQQIERLSGEAVVVLRNDAFEPQELIAAKPKAIVISPGPGTPARAGRIVDLIRANDSIPLLGVCLGHQAIGEAFGGEIVRGGVPVHGKVTELRHEGKGLFAGCPMPMRTARYHSLVIDHASFPRVLEIVAETEDGAVMAVSHRERPVHGIQFHPESYGTTGGDRIIANFLEESRR
jgi:anthranilate synthase component 2